MVVRDLINQCLGEDIIADVMAICGVDENERDSVFHAYSKLLDKLKEISPKDTGRSLLAYSLSKEGTDKLLVMVGTKEQAKACPVRCDLSGITDEERKKLLNIGSELKSDNGIKLMHWNEVMGIDLNEDNVSAVGAEKVAAAVIYEMTTYGLTEEEVSKERQEMQENEDAMASAAETN